MPSTSPSPARSSFPPSGDCSGSSRWIRDDFIYPAHERSERYLIVEIDTFEGRSADTKKDLVRQITRRINEATGIEPRDIDVIITEQPRHNWGLMGEPGDEIQLTYKVKV